MQHKNTRGGVEAYFRTALTESAEITPSTKEDVEKALKEHANLDDDEFMHLLVNLACFLGKIDRRFYYYKLAFLCYAIVKKPEGVSVLLADAEKPEDRAVFIHTKQWGWTTFHHNPGKLEKGLGHEYKVAQFAWSGFERQRMALEEALDPGMLAKNIAASLPVAV